MYFYAITVCIFSCNVVASIDFVNQPKNARCKVTDTGHDYIGRRSYTREDDKCLHWAELNVTYADEQFLYNTVNSSLNYCRSPIAKISNPDEEWEEHHDGPWCHTASGWGYCSIQKCTDVRQKTRECVKGSGFLSYVGKYTMEGVCMNWVDTPFINDANSLKYFAAVDHAGPAGSLEELSNYCRNPDNDNDLWCYNQKMYDLYGNFTKIYCPNVTKCSSVCRRTEGSLEYVGPQMETEAGLKCLPAQDHAPAILQSSDERRQWFIKRYPNDLYERPLKYCRSFPAQLQHNANRDGPVCFVQDRSGSIIEQKCAIPYCRFDVNNETEGDLMMSIGFTTPLPTTTPPTTTLPPRPSTTTSVEIGNAWKSLADFSTPEPQTFESAEGPLIGYSMISVLAFAILLFLLFDAVVKIKQREYCNDEKGPTTASRISLRRFHQVSPSDSEKTISTSTANSSSRLLHDQSYPLSSSQLM